MLTVCSAHCSDSTDSSKTLLFDHISNYIFSLLKAIYSVVFAFVCHHLLNMYKKLNDETLPLSSH